MISTCAAAADGFVFPPISCSRPVATTSSRTLRRRPYGYRGV